MTLHNFATSHNHDDATWWAEVYRSAWGDYESHDVITDRAMQRSGIDHVVHRTHGDETADVKVRDREWDDVALEVWSNKEQHVPGWLRKPLACDWIIYAYLPTGRAVFFPFSPLQALYEERKWLWREAGYRVIEAKNERYTTVSVCVPRVQLLQLVHGSFTVWFTP